MALHNNLGNTGEQIAVNYLIDKGYTIRERNFRYLKAEIDIIAQTKNTLAIVEVKTRSRADLGNPQDFISKKQIQNLIQAADHYVVSNSLDVSVRFDVVALLKTAQGFKIEHIPNAFFAF